MTVAAKSARGRKRGSGRFGQRTTVGLTTDLNDSIKTLSSANKQSQAETIRMVLEKGIQAIRPVENQVLLTLASADMEDLRRAVKYGHVGSVDFAIVEAVRAYLREWLPNYLEVKEKTLGNL